MFSARVQIIFEKDVGRPQSLASKEVHRLHNDPTLADPTTSQEAASCMMECPVTEFPSLRILSAHCPIIDDSETSSRRHAGLCAAMRLIWE